MESGVARKRNTERVATPTIGQLLRAARKARHKSQADVAKELGKTQPTVSEWEADSTLPDIRDVRAVAESYGLHPMQLLPEPRRAA
jgi:transcriptional regulator with XRE-family HTH domain